MKIAVIGHLCLDVIHHRQPNGQEPETRSYGGIFYAVAALAHLVDRQTTVVPVFGVGRGEYGELMGRLRAYENVATRGIYKFSGPTNQVHLSYHNDEQRTECSKFIADPIPFKRIKPYLNVDMVLINCISGFDITVETLDQIRMAVRARHIPVYFDVHSLSLGLKNDGMRFRRPVPEWRRWLFWLHAVQMNREEASGLTEEKFSQDDLAKHVTALNTPAMIITRGDKGCTVYVDEHKKLRKHDVPGNPVPRSIDATGCGDVFGAAYCANFLRTGNILESVGFASIVASFNATIAGSTDIGRLSRFTPSDFSEKEHLVSPGVTP